MITVLCPSRGNPEALLAAYTSFAATATERSSRFVALVDENDPRANDYIGLLDEAEALWIDIVPEQFTGTMNRALNWGAAKWDVATDIVGFVGDDHRFRTKGWDRIIEAVLGSEGGGILYGDDLAQRDQLPTQVFISSAIIRGLRWMGLPGARHLYLDNAWKLLGEEAGCLIYAPDVVIEHMHPAYGKGEWDEGHTRVNSAETYSHDREVYEQWISSGQAKRDVEIVRAAVARV